LTTTGGKHYFVTSIDDHSRYYYNHLLETKDEMLGRFKVYKAKSDQKKIQDPKT